MYQLTVTDDLSVGMSQEIQEGRKAICASMVLGQTGTDLMSRLSNRIYECCRTKSISLPAFPDFAPTIEALRSEHVGARSVTYKVCVQQQNKLKLLESMASKWLETDIIREQAMALIEKHNSIFNPDGEMWVEDRTLALQKSCGEDTLTHES